MRLLCVYCSVYWVCTECLLSVYCMLGPDILKKLTTPNSGQYLTLEFYLVFRSPLSPPFNVDLACVQDHVELKHKASRCQRWFWGEWGAQKKKRQSQTHIADLAPVTTSLYYTYSLVPWAFILGAVSMDRSSCRTFHLKSSIDWWCWSNMLARATYDNSKSSQICRRNRYKLWWPTQPANHPASQAASHRFHPWVFSVWASTGVYQEHMLFE